MLSLRVIERTVDLDNEHDINVALMGELTTFGEFEEEFILSVYRSAKGLENKIKLLKYLDENDEINKENVLEKIKTLYD